MSTIADAEDAFLEGSTVWAEWLNGFEAQFYAPLAMSILGAAMAQGDDATMQTLRAMNPESFDTVQRLLRR